MPNCTQPGLIMSNGKVDQNHYWVGKGAFWWYIFWSLITNDGLHRLWCFNALIERFRVLTIILLWISLRSDFNILVHEKLMWCGGVCASCTEWKDLQMNFILGTFHFLYITWCKWQPMYNWHMALSVSIRTNIFNKRCAMRKQVFSHVHPVNLLISIHIYLIWWEPFNFT